MNRQSFNTDNANSRKQFIQLLNALLDYNADRENQSYNDIHIYQEESHIEMEWEQVPYGHEWGGRFRYVDYDEEVMKDVSFPDGHHEMLYPYEVEDRLKEWHRDNPDWVKNQFGMWTNAEENRREYLDCCQSEIKERTVGRFVNMLSDGAIGCNHLVDDIVEDAKVDRLIHRTGYIAIGWNLEDAFLSAGTVRGSLFVPKDGYSTPDLEHRCHVEMIGKLKLRLDSQRFSKDSQVEYYDDEIPVYSCSEAVNEVWFFTDENYLLDKTMVKMAGTNKERKGD